MISFETAFQKVLHFTLDWGEEKVSQLQANGRVLTEDIKADRDFPPFDRSTKDGIAINFSGIEKGLDIFKVEGILSAGMPQQSLSSDTHCFEIMTGAVLPNNADTVIMYEEIEIEAQLANISKRPKKGQNIHSKGSDEVKGAVLVEKGRIISPAIIGVLASVGKSAVRVKKLPTVCVVSTGNELVEISEQPLPHQIRKSNTFSLIAALKKVNIEPTQLHLADDRQLIENELQKALSNHDVLMLSGGVSKGKFDFIPDALEALGVEKIFHRIAQRPGKPFWFGITEKQKKVVFSFPGNPVSTFANYHVYFLPWLAKSLRIETTKQSVFLDETITPHPTLTLFLQVKTKFEKGCVIAKLIQGNGSGDLISLAKADGFIRIPAGETEFKKGSLFSFIPCT
ncbi:hypothetical protein LCGC14_1055800 [marine sediment metagenome]|uniref:Molybdopterin molybdenumtransferase n=2 Tax=root TaxID=1 RepID=A0A831VSB5_9FLAO|nr:molybdopterin molybdenumtransferase MoeA [Pricia antarctica]